ncbi:MAG: hypothetical protein AB7O62_00175 [Pirellulales bacterium]
MIATLGSPLNSAQLCRANGWPAGTLLKCPDEPALPGRVAWLWITAVGDALILARYWSGSQMQWSGESIFLLSHRDWRSVPPAQAPAALVALMREDRCDGP